MYSIYEVYYACVCRVNQCRKDRCIIILVLYQESAIFFRKVGAIHYGTSEKWNIECADNVKIARENQQRIYVY